MPIKTHVQEMCEKQGITTAYKLQKALNISPSAAAKLFSDDFEMISKKSLERLCKLLHTTPGELVTYEPDKKGKERK